MEDAATWANVEEALLACHAEKARRAALDAELETTRDEIASTKRAREKTEAEIERLKMARIDLLEDIAGLQARISQDPSQIHEAGMPEHDAANTEVQAEVAVTEDTPTPFSPEAQRDDEVRCLLSLIRDTFITPPLSAEMEESPPPYPAFTCTPPPSPALSCADSKWDCRLTGTWWILFCRDSQRKGRECARYTRWKSLAHHSLQVWGWPDEE